MITSEQIILIRVGRLEKVMKAVEAEVEGKQYGSFNKGQLWFSIAWHAGDGEPQLWHLRTAGGRLLQHRMEPS